MVTHYIQEIVPPVVAHSEDAFFLVDLGPPLGTAYSQFGIEFDNQTFADGTYYPVAIATNLLNGQVTSTLRAGWGGSNMNGAVAPEPLETIYGRHPNRIAGHIVVPGTHAPTTTDRIRFDVHSDGVVLLELYDVNAHFIGSSFGVPDQSGLYSIEFTTPSATIASFLVEKAPWQWMQNYDAGFEIYATAVNLETVPEPNPLVLAAIGLVSFAAWGYRRQH
jgi:hypothetical protein